MVDTLTKIIIVCQQWVGDKINDKIYLMTNQEIKEIYKEKGKNGLMKITGVGPGIAYHIETLLRGKKFAEYERLKKKIPVNISELTAVEGLGPTPTKALYQKLKIKNL